MEGGMKLRFLVFSLLGFLLGNSFLFATLSEKELQIIREERRSKQELIIDILKTKPCIEGINDVYALLCLPISVEGYEARKRFLVPLIESVLKRLYDAIQVASADQKEMLINQSIFIDFMLKGTDSKKFMHFFKEYIGPFLIQSGFTENQIRDCIIKKLQKIRDIAKKEGVVYWVVANIDAQLVSLERL